MHGSLVEAPHRSWLAMNLQASAVTCYFVELKANQAARLPAASKGTEAYCFNVQEGACLHCFPMRTL